jgi:SPP1 gp7 family putative phage head morphogenesis protein
MSINDDIYDRQIDHTAMTRMFEDRIQTDTKRTVRKHRTRLQKIVKGKDFSTGTAALHLPEIQKEVNRFTKELDININSSMKDYALVETDFSTNNLNKSLGKYAVIRRPRATKVLEEIVGANVRGEGNLSRRVQGLGANELKRISSKIQQGLREGWDNKTMVASVVRTTRLTEAQASALVRTAVTKTQTTAQLASFKENEAVLKGMRFTAVLDNRTSAICAHHDGKIYELSDTRFIPPLHWRCRSTLVPVAKSLDEMLASTSPDVKKKALKAIPGSQVAKLNGMGPPRETYGQWLTRQPRDTKIRHFQGDLQKVNLFDSGQLPLESFTTASGKPLSLSALRRLDNKNTSFTPIKQKTMSATAINNLQISASKPSIVIRNKSAERELKDFFRAEAYNTSSTLSVVDYRGTSLAGKRASRRRANNQFDERNVGVDPLTGEQKSTLIYDPDFKVYQERIDFLDNSKLLNAEQKDWIKGFVDSLENEGLSVNQQTAVLENLRVVFERYAKDKTPWVNLNGVLKAELKNSVVNTSRILDRRSRSRSQLFRFGSSGDEAQVQILGEWTSFNDLSSRALSNQRFIDEFSVTTGLPLARNLYLSGRSPLRNYFPRPPAFIPKKSTVKKKIISQIESLPFGKSFIKKYKGEPSDSLLTRFLQAGNERKRRFLDLEWLYARKREDFIQKEITPDFAKARVKLLSEIVSDIATGESTDYDLLSIKIGKKIYEAEKSDFEIFFKSPDIKTYHKMGSEILEGLKSQGKIKVGLRGVTRRGVIDVETGRPAAGSFGDTISREVQIVDPEMLKLQRAKRELVYARRVGIVNERDRLYVKAGSKNFYDARGRKTSQSVITRRAGGNYDQNLVDKDFSQMLNHAMDFEWEIDPEFGSFFDDLMHFRDPRGKVAYYDELNSFRKIILQRGEQGAGMMQAIKWHNQNRTSWRNWAQIDGRGRVYTQGYLHPAGGEFVRPFLNTKIAKNISPEILQELRIQLGTLVGDPFDVLTNQGRLASFYSKEKQLRELGEIVLATTQRDRRIREFLEHPLVRNIEPEEVPKLARFAVEYTRIYNHVDGDFDNVSKLRTYKTKLGNENDASASGAQLIALSTRDRALSEASNVVKTRRKNRLYDLVAERTLSDPEFQKLNPLGNDLDFGDLAKAAKGQSMVAFYGAGQATQAGAIESKLAKVLAAKDYTVITASELRTFNKSIDQSIKQATGDDALSVAASLKQLKTEVNYSINNNVPIGKKILSQTRDIHPDSELFVNKLTNVKGDIVGPAQFKEIARIMSKHLSDIAPITENFVSYWKEVAEVYITESGKVDIPWVTVDGKLLYQRYRPTVQERITFTDPITGRKVSNIYEAEVEGDKFLGRSSIIDARSGLGVNGNHMNDASIVRKFHLWGRKNKVNTATIHDGFFTNLADSLDAKWALREIYADAVEGDTLLRTLKEMRRQGLSKESYDRLVKKAEELGLLNPENGITSEDILEEIFEDEDWYGLGP